MLTLKKYIKEFGYKNKYQKNNYTKFKSKIEYIYNTEHE